MYYTSFYHNIRTFHLISGECCRSSFYIKPQQTTMRRKLRVSCIASSFYIKPQLSNAYVLLLTVVLHPLSTSNHNSLTALLERSYVVLHPLSTSNHNRVVIRDAEGLVVLHPLSTSNHNIYGGADARILLYCILFLHQTTTLGRQTL